MPEEAITQTAEQADAQMSAELNALMKEPEPVAETVEAKPAAEAEQPATTDTEKPAETSLDDKLKEIAEEAPQEDETKAPALTEDQQAILKHVPDIRTAQELATKSQAYDRLDTAIASGDFESVEKMFAPDALTALHEHIYQRNIEKWVERWIAEHEGSPIVNQSVKRLESELAGVKQQLTERSKSETQRQADERRAEIGRMYNAHVEALFDRINTPKEDRARIKRLVDVGVGTNPQIVAAVNAGNMKAVNRIFAEEVNAFNRRDQQITQATEKTVVAQEKHKPLVQGATIAPEAALPDDINQVPKDRLDEWEAQQLRKVMGKK